jgi:hypothetical protein
MAAWLVACPPDGLLQAISWTDPHIPWRSAVSRDVRLLLLPDVLRDRGLVQADSGHAAAPSQNFLFPDLHFRLACLPDMGRELFPFRQPMKLDTLILGGMPAGMCTWSGARRPSIIPAPFHWHGSLGSARGPRGIGCRWPFFHALGKTRCGTCTSTWCAQGSSPSVPWCSPSSRGRRPEQSPSWRGGSSAAWHQCHPPAERVDFCAALRTAQAKAMIHYSAHSCLNEQSLILSIITSRIRCYSLRFESKTSVSELFSKEMPRLSTLTSKTFEVTICDLVRAGRI